jgi:ubiquinol oxidase
MNKDPKNLSDKIAIDYYGLPEDSRLRDVVVRVRQDEQGHADVNHDMADTLEQDKSK